MKRIAEILLLLLGIILLGVPAALAAPVVVETEGKYAMGDLDSKKDARTLALSEAKRLALEKAGTYIESKSEVKDYQLTRDQINSLASGVMSVEVLKEDWKMSGENMVATVLIRATIDTSNLKDRIAVLQEGPASGSFKEIQDQLAGLKKELAELKARKAEAAPSGEVKEAPRAEARQKHEGLMRDVSALELMQNGNAALMTQRWQDAETAFAEAIRLNPKRMDAYGGRAVALLKLNRPQEALDLVNGAIEMDPRFARNYAARAMILSSQGKAAEALPAMNKAIQINPRFPKFYLQRGDIHLAMKRTQLAVTDYKKACGMGVQKACERIDKVRQKPAGKSGWTRRPPFRPARTQPLEP